MEFDEVDVFFHAFPDEGVDQLVLNAVQWLNGQLMHLGTLSLNPFRPSASITTTGSVVRNGVTCQRIIEPWVLPQVGKFIGPDSEQYHDLYTNATTDDERREIEDAYQQALYHHEEVHQAITLKRRAYDRFNGGHWLPIRLRLLVLKEECLT